MDLLSFCSHFIVRCFARRRVKRRSTGRYGFERLESRELLAGDLTITEFMAANVSTLLDEDGESSDWIEVHNPTDSPVSLGGWHLTDDENRLDKWAFSDSELGPGEFTIVFASNKDRVFSNTHTNFKLSAEGEFLGLVRPDGTVAHDFGSQYPPQIPDISFGIPEGGSRAMFLESPTPGQPNSQARSSQVAFDRESGVFDRPFSLTLSVDTPGATIHFTTDGTLPTEDSPVYSGPITIESAAHVQAIAVATGVSASKVASAWFMKMDTDVASFSSNLPIVALESFGSPLRAGEFRFNALTIFEPDEVTGRSGLLAPPDLSTRSGFRIRGSSTAGQAKASYSFEAWDEQNRDKEISPLGLPSNSDWILYGAYDFDRTLMHNAFIYELSNQVGRYAVRTRFVEFFFNMDGGDLSLDDYRGVYTLMERIKRDPDRVDIAKLEPSHNREPEITGGWILKRDRDNSGDRGFSTNAGTIFYVDPAEQEVTPQQAAWIQNDFNEMLASLSDTNPETGYEQTIDVDSWIDHHMLNVLPMNVDAFRLSSYFFKDRNGKYQMGPIWDFDRTMGSEDGRDRWPNTWDGPGDSSKFFDDDTRHVWWGILFDDPNFMQHWIDRWFELRKDVLSEENVERIIDSMDAELTEAQARNFDRWPAARPNGGDFASPNTPTWDAEIRQLKGWLRTRLGWIDSQFLQPPTVMPERSRLSIGEPIRLAAESGTVYFTSDGSDPRLPGGAVSPNAMALVATGDLIFSNPVRIVARAERDGQWSAPLDIRLFVARTPDDATNLVISEINYNPHDPTDAELAIDSRLENDDFEFIELVNRGEHAIDLDGIRFADGIDFTLAGNDTRTLAPGHYGLVVQDRDAFQIRYGSDRPVIGEIASGRLNNDGETLVLADRFGVVLQQFSYGDRADWPVLADGLGSSLELVELDGDHDVTKWRASTEYGGSPGEPGSGPVRTVTINEILSHGVGGSERIELFNTTDRSIDASGWYLGADPAELFKFRIPDSTVITAGGFLVLSGEELGFALDGTRGGTLWLTETDAEGRTIRFADQAPFDAADLGISLGRWPNGDGSGSLVSMTSQTFGAPNRGPLVGPAIISEVHFNPAKLPDLDENFARGEALDFTQVLGEWAITDGRYEVTPDKNAGDTINILPALKPLSSQFSISATIRFESASDFNKNAALIFDYRSPRDFKFASIHGGSRRVRIGQRDAEGWNFLVDKLPDSLLSLDTNIDMTVAVEGSVVLLLVDGELEAIHNFGSSLSGGQVGLGSKGGKALFDNVSVARMADQEFEFVELLNTTLEPLDLTGWRLAGEVDLTFPEQTSLAAGELLVAVGFDPADQGSAGEFRRLFGVPESVTLVGPYRRLLGNEKASIRLMRPQASVGGGLILVDQIGYDIEPPWPGRTDGGGRSLGRKTIESPGNIPTSWAAQTPTAGSIVMAAAGDLSADGRVDANDIQALVLGLMDPSIYETTHGLPVTVAGDLDLDGDVDFDDIDDFLTLLNDRAALDGTIHKPQRSQRHAEGTLRMLGNDGVRGTWLDFCPMVDIGDANPRRDDVRAWLAGMVGSKLEMLGRDGMHGQNGSF